MKLHSFILSPSFMSRILIRRTRLLKLKGVRIRRFIFVRVIETPVQEFANSSHKSCCLLLN
jgi:hypothetical protein